MQGQASADYLADYLPAETVDKWIVYDIRSAERLAEQDIQNIDRSYLSGLGLDLSDQINETAYRIAQRWVEDSPAAFQEMGGVSAEKLYLRSFTYTMLVSLRAFNFLEKIRNQEGPCRVLTTQLVSNGPSQILRWGVNDSPLPNLLTSLKEFWPFDTQLYEMEEHTTKTQKTPDWYKLKAKIVRSSHSFKKGGVLFSGNSSLLDPVRSIVEASGFGAFTLKRVERISQLLHAFHPQSILTVDLPPPRRAASFDESKFYKVFQDKKTFVYQNIDFLPVIWDKVRNFYQWEIPRLSVLIPYLTELFDRIELKYVVVDEDVTPFHKLFVHLANERGIKTLAVLHGLPLEALGFVPLESNKMAVWSRHAAEIMRGWQVPEERLIITGCPKYDSLVRDASKASTKRSEFCKKWNWNEKHPMVLITPDSIRPSGLECLEGLEASPADLILAQDYFLQAARQVPDVNFIYKYKDVLHWDPLFEKRAKQQGEIPFNFKIVMEGLGVDYLPACDLVFNGCSSATLEAVLLKKPVSIVQLTPLPKTPPYERFGLQSKVTGLEDILTICKALAEGTLPVDRMVTSQEGIIEPFLFSRDGKAAARVAEVICNSSKKQEIPSQASFRTSVIPIA